MSADKSETKKESDAQNLVRLAASLFQRGLTNGSSGNISMRVAGGFLVTPTTSCLGFLQPERLSFLDETGQHVSGDAPTKELPLHLTIYKMRPTANAIVHLHSTYATLLSCCVHLNPADCIPPLTPYVVMRVGQVALVPYTMPGSAAIIPLLEALSPRHAALLLANHGPVVAGTSLENALFALEELEETAKLVHLANGLVTRGVKVNYLSDENIAELKAKFKA